MHLVQLKLNADSSIAQTHKSHSPKIAPLLLADYWKEIRGWKEKALQTTESIHQEPGRRS